MPIKLFVCLVVLLSAVVQVEGLAFVTAIVNPVAGIRALNPIRMFSPRSVDNAGGLHAHDAADVSSAAASSVEDHIIDETIKNHRNQIVDLVYMRSLERMNSFGVEESG